MGKFKNVYESAGRSQNFNINNNDFKHKSKKSGIKKLLRKCENSFTEFLQNASDVVGEVSKHKTNKGCKIIRSKMPKNLRKKIQIKYSEPTNFVYESSDEEPLQTFDEDGQLAANIKLNLMKSGFQFKNEDYTNNLKKKANCKETIKRKTSERDSESSDNEFDADGVLARLLKEKVSEKSAKYNNPGVSCSIQFNEGDIDMENMQENIYDGNANDDDEENIMTDISEDIDNPGKFVLLKPHSEMETDILDTVKQSQESSVESYESKEDSELSRSSEHQVDAFEMEFGREEAKTEENSTAALQAHVDKNHSDVHVSEFDNVTEFYDDLENPEVPSQTEEDLLYDSVFVSQTNIAQPNNPMNYSLPTSLSLEPIQAPKVNGVSADNATVGQGVAEKSTEDVVEILSSDDEEEKPAEKESTQVNNHVSEETSDDIFNDVQFYAANQQVIVVLKHPTRLYFWGKLVATTLFGNVCILGCNLQQAVPYSIYSPCGLGKLYFETITSEEEFNPLYLFPKLAKTGLSTFDTEQIVTTISENDVVLYLQDNNTVLTRYINFLDVNPKPFPTARRSSIRNDDDYKTTLQTFFYKQEECTNGLNVGDSWYGISNYVFSKMYNSKVLVCGGKGVGKSTFNRFLLNRHVNNTPVIYVDLDIGQPEFGIPGTISVSIVNGPIFGPSYMHTRTNFLKMRFVREIDIMENLNLYLNTVKIMMDELWEEYADLPWIINTMGFVKTFGDSVNIAVIKLAKPSFVIQIHDKDAKNNYTIYMRPDVVQNYNHGLDIELPHEPCHFEHMLIMTETDSKKVSLEPRHIRHLNIISYFSNMLNEDKLYLTELVPKMAPISSLKIWTFDSLAPSLIRNSLNASLVALCKVESDLATSEHEGLHILPHKLNVAPICLGFGIVRGVNLKAIYILSPLSSKQLEEVNCIASCSQTLPSSMLTKISPDIKGHTPFISLKRNRPLTSNIPKRNYHLQRSRSGQNVKM